ncbi:hypothetical protein FRB90_001511 [Tulasnella sp. 427]|nr:hypothetical protein FRB90_001511 [Tulasnella sp. 427]
MPPTATMSTSSPASANNMLASAGFLSPTQESVVFFGGSTAPPPGVVQAGGRGRTSTRSASSSGISDRSRSSSKISGTSSPLGSVSPSGYGSPSGSRASSVLGYGRRSSTDVGVAVAGNRSIRRENGAVGSARNSSTSPPVVSSPLATNSLPASSLGTIVANVPMEYPVVPERGGGPPLSRSGIIANGARMVGPPPPSSSVVRPKLGSRTSSSSSVTSSTASSGSSGETASAMRTPRENVKMVLPAAPAAAVSAPLPVEAVKKPATSSLVLPEGPRPTVIISPQSGSESPSAGTSMSMDTRDSKLEEEMRKVKAAQATAAAAAAKGSAPVAVPAPAPSNKAKQVEGSDPEEVESGTFDEYKSTNRTPSNSPVRGLAVTAIGSSKQQPPLQPSSVPPTPQSPPPPPPAVNGTLSPPSTPRRTSFQSPTSIPNKGVVSPGTVVITPPSTSAPALTPTEESGIVGMAANSLVSSAKGMLGAIWSLGGEGVKQ